MVIFSVASCHEKDTGSFIGRDLLTPRRERQRERETERGAFSHFISYINVYSMCWCLASSILNRM